MKYIATACLVIIAIYAIVQMNKPPGLLDDGPAIANAYCQNLRDMGADRYGDDLHDAWVQAGCT